MIPAKIYFCGNVMFLYDFFVKPIFNALEFCMVIEFYYLYSVFILIMK